MKTYSHLRARNKNEGFTLIEFIVVVALAAIVVGALAWSINKAFGSNDTKDEAAAVTKVMAAIPDLRGVNGYGTAATNLVPQLIAQNEIPSTWQVIAGVPKNSWGGNVTVVSQVSYVDIASAGISQEACNKLATKLSRGNGFKQTKINAAAAIVGEVTSAAAAAACVDGTNTITWSTQS